MREILFRGKTDKGEWVYGSPIFQDGYVLIRFWNSEEFEFEEYLVIPDAIGQYTGLTDKNGTKIFEGDIVQHDFGAEQIGVQYAVVKYNSKYASFMIEPLYDWMYCDKNDCEVIGNIHDNSELLGGDQNAR